MSIKISARRSLELVSELTLMDGHLVINNNHASINSPRCSRVGLIRLFGFTGSGGMYTCTHLPADNLWIARQHARLLSYTPCLADGINNSTESLSNKTIVYICLEVIQQSEAQRIQGTYTYHPFKKRFFIILFSIIYFSHFFSSFSFYLCVSLPRAEFCKRVFQVVLDIMLPPQSIEINVHVKKNPLYQTSRM
jgi:hypothetical protein